MARKKYIRRRIVKLPSIHDKFNAPIVTDQLEEILAVEQKKYKYVRFGITTDLKEEYDIRKQRDDIQWSSMKVYYVTPYTLEAEYFFRHTRNNDNYIPNNKLKFPIDIFEKYEKFYVYVMVGKKKKSKKQMSLKNIKLGSVFSGIGAIEQTFMKMKLSHEIVFACDNGERELKISKEEIDEYLRDVPESEREHEIEALYNKTGKPNLMELSYKENYDIKDGRFFQDIRYLDGSKFKGEVDIIVGGSPCQAFSCNGKRGGFNDTRGTLFYEYARIIKESQPKCFIFENVRGMINHDKGRTWATIRNVFQELNYHIYIHRDESGKESPMINAADYGIPQLRMRLYVVGIRKDIELKENFSFPMPIPLTTTVSDYLDPNVPAKYYLGQKGFEFVTTHPSRAQVGIPIMTCQKANQQFNWNGTFIFEPLDYNKHNSKIMEKAYLGNWKGVEGVIRMFTPRECLRLMGFSDDFKIKVNDNMMWRQAGNSIVVNVLEAIMKEIINTGIFDIK